MMTYYSEVAWFH